MSLDCSWHVNRRDLLQANWLEGLAAITVEDQLCMAHPMEQDLVYLLSVLLVEVVG